MMVRISGSFVWRRRDRKFRSDSLMSSAISVSNLYKTYGSALPVAIYVAVSCAISGLSAWAARETRGVELADIR